MISRFVFRHVLLLTLPLLLSAFAQGQDRFRDKIEAGPHMVLPFLGEGDSADTGFGVQADYHWNPRISTELAYTTFDDKVGLGFLGDGIRGSAGLDIDLWAVSAKYNVWSLNRNKRTAFYVPSPRFRTDESMDGSGYRVDGRDDYYSEGAAGSTHHDGDHDTGYAHSHARHAGETTRYGDHHGRNIEQRVEEWDDIDISHENDANVYVGLGLSYLDGSASLNGLDIRNADLAGDFNAVSGDLSGGLGWHFLFGADYGFTENWEVFAEYRHTFVSSDVDARLSTIVEDIPIDQSFSRSLSYDVGMLRIGFNYRW